MIILRQKEFGVVNCELVSRVGNTVIKGVTKASNSNKAKVSKKIKRMVDKASKTAQSITGDRDNMGKVAEGIVVKTRAPKKSTYVKIKDPAQRKLFDFHRDPDPVQKKLIKQAPRIGMRTETIETGKIGERVHRIMSDGSIKTYQTGQYHFPWAETTDKVFIGK